MSKSPPLQPQPLTDEEFANLKGSHAFVTEYWAPGANYDAPIDNLVLERLFATIEAAQARIKVLEEGQGWKVLDDEWPPDSEDDATRSIEIDLSMRCRCTQELAVVPAYYLSKSDGWNEPGWKYSSKDLWLGWVAEAWRRRADPYNSDDSDAAEIKP